MESDYWNALDKGKEMRIDPKQIGISHGIGDVGEGLKANVFRGAKVVELGFMGAAKGSRSQPGGHTPESYGIRERQEMRELAKINEIEVSTHASPNVGYASGYQEGAFRDETRQFVLHEVKRAIDFASDVTQGGPVVMHLGEFPRPLYSLEKTEEGKPRFLAFPEEEKKAPLYVVDDRTGKLEAIRRDAEVTIPKPAEEGMKDPWKNPLRNSKTGLIEFETKKISDFEEQAYKEGKDPVKFIFDKLIHREIELNEGEERRLTSMAQEIEDKSNMIQRRRLSLEKGREKNPVTARLDAIEFGKEIGVQPPKSSPDFENYIKDPYKYIKDSEEEIKMQAEGYKKTASSYGAQAYNQRQQTDHMVPVEKYGLKQTAETIALAAMNAYEMEKQKHLKEPLWIAPENWRPEEYGSHPDEYRKIIEASRSKMTENLQGKGMGEDEAKKVAEDHIKGTFDVGHANFWYKFYQGSKKDFDNWLTNEVGKLTKDGIIGHVHLSDNFGYHDEHLSPGEGNVPIQRFVEKMKEKGYTGKFIAEPGGQKEGRFHQPLTESWKILGSPMYRIDMASQSWTDIESSYFGRAPQAPNFIVGDYAPSKDWTLWSEVPLE